MKHFLIILFLSLLFAGCDLVNYHPYQELDGYDSQFTPKNIALIEPMGKHHDTLCFAFVSDIQRSYDDLNDFCSYVNKRSDIDFVLIGGDLTDFGLTDEYRWTSDELQQLHKPWLTVIGNHDFLGLGEYNYLKIYGPYNYSLNVGHTHIVCLNTIWRDSNGGINAPDFDFLRQDLTSVFALNALRHDSITHTVVMMHNMPGDEQFDNRICDRFLNTLTHYPGLRLTDPVFSTDDVQKLSDAVSVVGTVKAEELKLMHNSPLNGFCIKGHTHHHSLQSLGDDNLLFYCVDNLHRREMLLFTLYPQGYAFESVYF